MASELLKLTTEILIAHASLTVLTPEQLVGEIKDVYNMLSSLEGGVGLEQPAAARPGAATVKQPPIPLKDIVTAKYVVCLECGRRMRTLKNHLNKTHNLKPKEYFQRHALDPKKFPLACKDYSAARSQMAKERGFGTRGVRRKAAKPA